jgi:hypothetical protein
MNFLPLPSFVIHSAGDLRRRVAAFTLLYATPPDVSFREDITVDTGAVFYVGGGQHPVRLVKIGRTKLAVSWQKEVRDVGADLLAHGLQVTLYLPRKPGKRRGRILRFRGVPAIEADR